MINRVSRGFLLVLDVRNKDFYERDIFSYGLSWYPDSQFGSITYFCVSTVGHFLVYPDLFVYFLSLIEAQPFREKGPKREVNK